MLPDDWQRIRERGRHLMSELKRVDEDLPPEVLALAQALRDLFQGLGISTRRYAARRSYDSGTVSRYLSGRRLPPWEFVLNLLHDVAEERGNVPTEETIGMLRALHDAALRAGNSPVHKVQLLQRQLAEADQEARRAAMRERLLEDAVQDREHRIRDLQMRYRELQAASVSSAEEGLGDATSSGGSAEEHARLRAEIHDLQEELARVRALHRRAEERCEQLERQLADAERTAERVGETALLPEVFVPDARNGDRASSGASGVFGQSTTVHGDLNVFTSGWQVDEEYVESVTVQMIRGDTKHRGNGLLVDAETVVTFEHLLPLGGWRTSSFKAVVRGDGRIVRAASIERYAVTHRKKQYYVVALRLYHPLPFPARPLTADQRPTPGSQLLVNAYTWDGPYSCVLEVNGRTGEWLRVSGEIKSDLDGAPAFSSTGGLVGLLSIGEPGLFGPRDSERGRGHILPVSTLQALKSVNLST
ncbi:hypothetical protein Sipo8835_16175 [Streptomyces ipomoeae]|uniref:Uncharacterized protein n=1 Tax=Streptomyces ipomoeae TaxID=103232 RepID=A0AAE9B044_9ACTN|nr:hypothetical protein [Streptomyces ipomoeae]TQE34054.1 hypothetical protein Sipo8835_16175 [Streptomyces ipomoeae]